MKKFFSCMIMAAVVLGMASCGEALDPNDPNEYCFIVTYDADGDPVTLNVWATNSEMLEEVLPGITADGYIPKYKKVDVQSERECDYYTEYVDDEEDEPTMTPEEMIVGQWYYGERGNNNYLTFYKDNSCYFNSNSEVGYDPYTHTGTCVMSLLRTILRSPGHLLHGVMVLTLFRGTPLNSTKTVQSCTMVKTRTKER